MAYRSGLLKNLNIDAGINDIKFLTKLASCAEEYMTGDVWPEGVNVLLKTLGEYFKVSRVWVFQLMNLTDTHITQDYIFEWASEPKYAQIGLSRFNMFTNELGNGEYRSVMESRMRGEWQSVVLERLSADFIRDDIESQGILSMLTVPLFVNGKWWGILGFDDCERAHDWTISEISFLRIAGLQMENLILRNQMAAQEKQFSALNSLKESGLWSLDIKTWHIRFTSGLDDVPLTNVHSAEYPFRTVLKIIHPEDRKKIVQYFREGLFTVDTKSIRQDVRLLKNDNTYKWVEIIGNAHFDSSGAQTLIAGIIVDILDRKEIEEKLKNEATIDPLTGVMNRRAFAERLDAFIAFSQKNNAVFSVLMIDLDFFKSINDKWGHSVGDIVLKNFTTLVGHMLRKDDVFARYGGEEFIILLPDTDSAGADVFGNRIRKYIENSPCVVGDDEITFTISLGSTTYNGERFAKADDILVTADNALYQAKNSGRNNLKFSPMCIK